MISDQGYTHLDNEEEKTSNIDGDLTKMRMGTIKTFAANPSKPKSFNT